VRGVCRRLSQRSGQPVHRRQDQPSQPPPPGSGGALDPDRADGGGDGGVLRIVHQPR
jgi:hypothetical protein